MRYWSVGRDESLCAYRLLLSFERCWMRTCKRGKNDYSPVADIFSKKALSQKKTSHPRTSFLIVEYLLILWDSCEVVRIVVHAVRYSRCYVFNSREVMISGENFTAWSHFHLNTFRRWKLSFYCETVLMTYQCVLHVVVEVIAAVHDAGIEWLWIDFWKSSNRFASIVEAIDHKCPDR